MFSSSIHRKTHLFFTIILLSGLSLGKLLMSVSLIGLSINWLLEGEFLQKWNYVKNRHYSTVIISMIFFIQLIWLGFTPNIQEGLNLLRINLPFLALPIVFGSTPFFIKKELKIIIICFLLSVLISTLWVYLVDIGALPSKQKIETFRDSSIFMSHIRYSLLLCFVILLLLYLLSINKIYKGVGIIIITWLLFLIYNLGSLTAILGLITALGVYILYFIVNAISKKKKLFYLFFLVLLFIFSISYLINIHSNYYTPKEKIELINLPEKTLQGNKYLHDTTNLSIENGYYLWLYISEKEVENSWNKLSQIQFHEKDKKGQPIKYTIYRYLTSKGLNKDAQGMQRLTKQEIIKIESGNTSCRYYNRFESRVRESFFEWDNFQKTGNPNNHSFTQRIYYWKIAKKIIFNSPVLGHGTGASKEQFKLYYHANQTVLKKENQKRSHNQFLTLIINLGLLGFVLVIFCLLWPIFKLKITPYPLFLPFISLMFFAFLSDDMLERQAGVTIFCTIYVLIVAYSPVNKR